MSQGKVEELPDEYDEDLHGHQDGGRMERRTAYDIKELHSKLPHLTNDQLRAITVLPEGAPLRQGGMYCDLSDLERGAFLAEGNPVAESGHYYVPKNETGYELWNLLTGGPEASAGR